MWIRIGRQFRFISLATFTQSLLWHLMQAGGLVSQWLVRYRLPKADTSKMKDSTERVRYVFRTVELD